jgi:hypothetical protein
VRAGEGFDGTQATYWSLILLVCSAEGAAGPRAVLLRSSKLKELLWDTLEYMVCTVEELRVGGFDEVRALLSCHLNCMMRRLHLAGTVAWSLGLWVACGMRVLVRLAAQCFLPCLMDVPRRSIQLPWV